MLILDAAETRARLPWGPLVDALAAMFKAGCEMPLRHHHQIEVPGEPEATLLLMPAWSVGRYLGVKIANVFPGNAGRGMPAVAAGYLLSSGANGAMLAMIDGGELTARRTAAASVLAARYLARPEASRLLVCGTGRIAVNLARAYAGTRRLETIEIWGRSASHAARAAAQLADEGLPARAVDDLAAATARAEIISCATLSASPIVPGAHVRPGTHVDLVGGYRPDMREADDALVRKAGVFVDTRAGATKEAGDIILAQASGALAPDGIRADLYELTRELHRGRAGAEEITLFKSVGAALEDLAAAILVYECGNR
jgi:ornithine cyclodeaminase